MKKAELLLPAGNIEKMKYAIAYGADAVYLGVVDFSLRSMKSGEIISTENLKEAVNTAHKMGAKAYVTINIFAHNEDIKKLPSFIDIIKDVKPDGVIFSDFGIYSLLKKQIPDIPLHVSTQANTLNYETVKFWRDLGAKRVILARELSLHDIEEISSEVPDIELETFVHGSLCVSYSGRCLLSNYMTANERQSNHGNCAQPCRWNYKLVEEKRPGQYFDIEEDSRGTYILNPKDIAFIKYIPDLINAGVSSFKIEGRTKSLFYASIVAKAYRNAIDAFYSGSKFDPDELLNELSLAGNRGFTTGYLINQPDETHYDYNTSKGTAGATFVGIITDKISSNRYQIKLKNQIKAGDKVEWVFPDSLISSDISNIINSYNEAVEVANTNETVYLELDSDQSFDNWQWGIIRRKEFINV